MAMPSKKGWLAMIFIVACLAIPFGLTYYVSTEGFKDEYSMWQEEKDAQAPQSQSIKKGRVVDGRVTLVLGERVPVHNTSLVYKGIENDRVNVDLYLEDLDPASAYPQSFLQTEVKERTVRFGDVSYKVIEIGRKTMVLEILGTMEAD